MGFHQTVNEPQSPELKTLFPLQKIGWNSDEEIVQKVLAGDISSFEILIRRYNPLLYKIARGYGFNHQDAEDLMQETHFKAYTALNQLQSAYKSWLSKILINKCLYKLKHGYSKYEHPDSTMINENTTPLFGSDKIADPAAKRELSKVIEACIQQIPVNFKTVFILREVEGFSVAETAYLLELTEVNVKVRLNRAKAMLQKRIEQLYNYKEIYEFNLVYCDKIVTEVFKMIDGKKKFQV